MSYLLNDTIYDGFILRDNAEVAISGKISTDFLVLEAYLLSLPGVNVPVTLAETGAGEYTVSFTPSVEGDWFCHVHYVDGLINREWQETYDIYSSQTQAALAPPAVISGGFYLRDIRAGIARLCMDWVRFEATETSADTSVFIDNRTGFENDDHFRGSDLWFKNDTGTVANRGKVVRVVSSSLSNLSLSLGAGLVSAPVLGDIAWAYNIGGIGERITTYDATINDAIRSLGPGADIPYDEDTTINWDDTAPWVDIPATFTALSSMQYFDSDSIWKDIPNHSFVIDLLQRKVALSEDYTSFVDGKLVRFIGKQAHPELTLDTNTTHIDFEWMINECASQLLLNKKEQSMINKGGLRKANADALRGKAVRLGMIENSVRLF